ncbi:hypothetical protein PRNP1_005335 [Phytophthora ramorum]
MATCSEVASCLSEGATVCILTSGTCPPCVYALSGGDFSCYSRDTSGACPFSGAYAECDKASSSTSSTSSKTNASSGDSSGSSNNDTPAPTTKTKAPAKTTATPTATTAPTTSTSSSTGSNANSNETPSTDATTAPPTDATTSPSTDATSPSSATTASSSTDQTTQTASSSSSDSGAEKALTSNTASTTGSPAVVNLALIGGAVVLVVIVIAFVARRVVKKKKLNHTQERTVSSHNSAWSDRTLGTGASGGNLYSTYSYKDEAGKGNGISMLSDSQASSTYGPGYDQSEHSGSSPRSKADFSNYGGDSQYATESQYYNDYSVSTGPELMAAGAAAGNQHPYANNTVPPSARGNNNFVDATSMANRESSIGSVRQHPLTVSQLMPTSIEEDEEQAYASRRPAPEQYHIAVPPVPQTTRTPQIFAASTASSMRSDYDIVDPITMQDVEARNTEMLAEDSRYPKFSFESEASSDVYDGSSSEEESDDERVRHGEHTI